MIKRQDVPPTPALDFLNLERVMSIQTAHQGIKASGNRDNAPGVARPDQTIDMALSGHPGATDAGECGVAAFSRSDFP